MYSKILTCINYLLYQKTDHFILSRQYLNLWTHLG